MPYPLICGFFGLSRPLRPRSLRAFVNDSSLDAAPTH